MISGCASREPISSIRLLRFPPGTPRCHTLAFEWHIADLLFIRWIHSPFFNICFTIPVERDVSIRLLLLMGWKQAQIDLTIAG